MSPNHCSMAIRPMRETTLIFQHKVLWNFVYMEYLNYNFCKKVPIYLCQQHNHMIKATCFLKCYKQMLPNIVEKYMLGCETSHQECFIQKCFQVTASHTSTCRFVKTLLQDTIMLILSYSLSWAELHTFKNMSSVHHT